MLKIQKSGEKSLMKMLRKWTARITVITMVLGFLCYLLYRLYIEPLNNNESIDGFLENFVAVTILTVIYGIAGFLLHLLYKLGCWAIDNLNL